jgi:hypothetical protein
MMLRALWTELAGLEDDLDVLEARATIAQGLAIVPSMPATCRRPQQATTLAAIADELGDENGGWSPPGRPAWPT